MSTRPPTALCVSCLYRIGWGIKRIMRQTGYPKTTIHRYARANGLTSPDEANAKRDAVNQKRKAAGVIRAQEQRIAREQKAASRAEQRALMPKKKSTDWYYANLDKARARGRAAWIKRYQIKKADPVFKAKRLEYRKKWMSEKVEYLRLKRNAWAKTPAGRAASKRHRMKPLTKAINNLRKRLRDYAKQHGTRTLALIGCSSAHLRAHLEFWMKPGMTWDNYGQWHIDHIRPCASYDLTKHKDRLMCFHYTNLQPMWAGDNMAKSCKRPTSLPLRNLL